MVRYTVLMIPHGDGGYTADIVSLPGCVTWGDSYEEALALATDAAAGWLATAAETGMEIPTEPDGTTVAEIEVSVPALARA